MAHTDAHGFQYDNDVLDAVKDAETVQEILDLLGYGPWDSKCRGHVNSAGNDYFCAGSCHNA